MPAYYEISPPHSLSETVECLWVMQHSADAPVTHRVLPDGCADLLFTGSPGKPSLHAVGAMTRFEDFQVSSGQVMVGIRFHPGMWASQVGLPGDRITDQLLPLEALWGKRARIMLDRLAHAGSPQRLADMLVSDIQNVQSPTPVQRALTWMRQRHGIVALDNLASQANLSPRQFRRLCLEQAGLSPKLLARVLRFRHALSRIHSDAGDHAGLAADCGYFDQSHFIADFQRFSGHTPGSYFRP